MKKLLIPTSFFLVFGNVSFANANSMDLPHGCGFKSNFSHNTTNISSAIENGYGVYQNQYSWLDWGALIAALGSLQSTPDMSTDGPDYVLQGEAARFKYNGGFFDMSSRWYTVHFGTSEFGSHVETRSNWDNNAYKNLTFNYTHGPGLVWSDGKGCMAKSVLVQKRPSITKKALSSNYSNMINAKVNFSVDLYSEAKVKNKNSKVKFIFNSEEGEFGTTGWLDTGKVSGDYTKVLNTQYGGTFHVRAIISDGNYTSDVNLGIVYVGGPAHRPCPSCETDV